MSAITAEPDVDVVDVDEPGMNATGLATMTLNMSAKLESDYYQDTLNFERIVGITIPCFFSVVICIGCIGNILVILAILRNKQMQNSTNALIVNLAVSDLLFLIMCVPFTAADYALPVWEFSRAFCKLLNYLQSVTAYASVWTLVLMACDRYLAVVFPIESMAIRTLKNAMISCGLLWAIILVSNSPHIWENDVFVYHFIKETRSVCTYIKAATRTGTVHEIRSFYLSFNALGYLLPLATTLVLYALMLRKLWFRMPLSGSGAKRASEEAQKNKRRVTYMVSAVTGVFAISWLPLNIAFFYAGIMYNYKNYSTKSFFVFQVTSQALAYANSCLNPILYAFLSENFRKMFYELLMDWRLFAFCVRRCCGESQRRHAYHKAPRVREFEQTYIAVAKFRRGSADCGVEQRRWNRLIPQRLRPVVNRRLQATTSTDSPCSMVTLVKVEESHPVVVRTDTDNHETEPSQ